MGKKKHINKVPPKIPGQSREDFVYVFLLFLYVLFSLPKPWFFLVVPLVVLEKAPNLPQTAGVDESPNKLRLKHVLLSFPPPSARSLVICKRRTLDRPDML